MNTIAEPLVTSAARWEYLQELHDSLKAVLLQNLHVLDHRATIEALPETHPSRTKLLDLMKVIENDSNSVQRRLASVQKRHLGKTGTYEHDMDALMEVIGISEDYHQIHTLYIEAGVCMVEEFLTTIQQLNAPAST